MRCELTLIFIVGHSSCAHRVSIRSLTRFRYSSVVSCSPCATGCKLVRGLRYLPEIETLGQKLFFAVLWINTRNDHATKHLAPAVRYAHQTRVIGHHPWSQKPHVPIFWCFLVCDSRYITAPVHGWPWASTSVTYSSTFNSLTQFGRLMPKDLFFGRCLACNLLFVHRFAQNVDAPAGKLCGQSSILSFFSDG